MCSCVLIGSDCDESRYFPFFLFFCLILARFLPLLVKSLLAVTGGGRSITHSPCVFSHSKLQSVLQAMM